MRSATIRRFAIVAVMVLLAPVWARPAPIGPGARSSGATLAGVTPVGAPAAPAIRGHVGGGWWAAAIRTDVGRRLPALAVLALVSLLLSVSWTSVAERRSAPSPLRRRRHVIALRAPPLPACS
jgi:hypothetical protein